MPPGRAAWRLDVRQDAYPAKAIQVRVERNTDLPRSGTSPLRNHPIEKCPSRLADEETTKLLKKQHRRDQRLRDFQERVNQRVRVLRHIKEEAELKSTESEVQRRERFVEQNIVMAHNPGRYNSLQVRVNRQQTHCESPDGYHASRYRESTEELHQQSSDLRSLVEVGSSERAMARRTLLSCTDQRPPGDSDSQVAIATSQSAPTRLLFEKPNTDRSILSEDKMTHGKTTQEPRACSHNSEHSRDKQLLKTTPDSSPSSLVSEVRPLHVAVAVPQATESASRVLASRRLFMDLERAQVQELRRQKRLGDQVHRLLRAREQRRQEVELMDRVKKGEDVVASEQGEHEDSDHDRQEAARTAAGNEQEMTRYINALRERARQRSQRRPLPPICGCADNAWLSHPDTCASNCPFHRDPRAYMKALAQLLARTK